MSLNDLSRFSTSSTATSPRSSLRPRFSWSSATEWRPSCWGTLDRSRWRMGSWGATGRCPMQSIQSIASGNLADASCPKWQFERGKSSINGWYGWWLSTAIWNSQRVNIKELGEKHINRRFWGIFRKSSFEARAGTIVFYGWLQIWSHCSSTLPSQHAYSWLSHWNILKCDFPCPCLITKGYWEGLGGEYPQVWGRPWCGNWSI